MSRGIRRAISLFILIACSMLAGTALHHWSTMVDLHLGHFFVAIFLYIGIPLTFILLGEYHATEAENQGD